MRNKPPLNKKLQEFVNALALRVENAEMSLEEALKQTRDSLKNHPVILAHLNRN